MVGSGEFTAEQLAFRAGLPLRTVRFYVQEKLIDPPLGRGPGAHFTAEHLVQLQQARTLQNAGFSLEAIRERRGDLSVGLAAMQQHDRWRARWHAEPQDEELFDAAEALRIPMADGVDLLIDRDRRLPSPKQLVDIALYIRKIFGDR
jgi:DNA-binding transcriptional MerR regulator